MRTVKDIILSVQDAWARFNHYQLERAFCTLQTDFEEIVITYGENMYEIHHMNKDGIWAREGAHSLRERAQTASQTAIEAVYSFFEEEH